MRFTIFRRVTAADYLSLLAALLGFCAMGLIALGYTFLAVLAMFIAAIADYVDGRIARWVGGGHEWGKNIDSLCDVSAFAIAPAFLAWIVITPGLLGFGVSLALIAGFAFPAMLIVAGILRLARYNISTMHGLYVGMPITMNGVIFPVVWIMTIGFTAEMRAVVMAATCFISAALMISDFVIRKR